MRLRRRPEVTPLIVAWRAEPDAVRAALAREQVPSALGPSSGGWTVARLLVEDTTVLEPRVRDVADLLDDLARTLSAPGLACFPGEAGSRLLLLCVGGASPLAAQVPGLPLPAQVPGLGRDAPDREAWSALLGALGRLDVLAAVLDAAAPGEPSRPSTATLGADRRALAVAALLDLPPTLLDPDVLDEPTPWREAVVGRRLVAAEVALAAAGTGQPLLLAEHGGDGTVVASSPDGVGLLPAALLLASLRTPVLLLWRRGHARGWVLVRLAAVQDAHVWTDAWSLVEPVGRADGDPFDETDRAELTAAVMPPQGDAAGLADRLGAPGTDVVALRTVLRRPPGADVLADLCRVLGLDPAAALAVEGEDPMALPGGREVAPASGAAALWDAAAAPRPGDPWYLTMGQRKPWWYRLADLAFAVLAVLGAVALWDGGGTAARIGAALLVVLAVASVVDAVTPGYGRRAARRA